MTKTKKTVHKKATSNNTSPKIFSLVDLFTGVGFQHIKSDDIHFTFKGYKSEIDHIFAIENLLILCEETEINDVSKHFPKKQPFHTLIHTHPQEFFEEYRLINTDFDQYLNNSEFNLIEFEVRSVYYSSKTDFSDNIQKHHSPFTLLTQAIANYFLELYETIGKSAKFELYKFLQVQLSQLGDQKKSGQGTASNSFTGHVLPSRHSSYTSDITLVSFYVDPSSLIRRAYVLRREGWENSDVSYQRFVKREKLAEMRRYLANDGQVFLNNLILTLPSSIVIRDTNGQTLLPSSISELCPVELQLRDELGTIGIIDGQHRVLAYFEGSDEFENKVARVRGRHNLLATGIILPSHFTADERVRFEADLFLRINSTQTPLTDNLKQALETLIHPENPISITNLVLQQLAASGPLAGKIQTTVTGDKGKVKTASFSRNALLPLLSPEGKKNLFTVWSKKGNNLSSTDGRIAYIEYARKTLNTMLGAMKNAIGGGLWKPKPRGIGGDGMLSPTSIGGAFFYMRNLILSDIDPEQVDFSKTFNQLSENDFTSFKSSGWSACGKALYSKHPPVLKAGSKTI